MRDPYSHNSRLLDPYSHRNAFRKDEAYSSFDPYAARDPYARRDGYKNEDPYANRSGVANTQPRRRKIICQFWFITKEILQDLFSSDISLHEEKKVFVIDKDLFRLKFLGNIAIKTIVAFFTVLVSIYVSYLLLLFANNAYKTIIAFLDVLLAIWVLYCPAHQTFTAGAYAISENTINFYKIWKNSFVGYQLKVLLAYIIGAVTLGYFAVYPRAIDMLMEYFHIELYTPGSARSVYFFLLSVIGTIVGFYFLFASWLHHKSLRLREENYKANVYNRKKTIAQKYQSALDESEIPASQLGGLE